MTVDLNPPSNQNDGAAAIPVWIASGPVGTTAAKVVQLGQTGTQIYGNASGGGVALPAPANQNIRRLQVTVSGDASIASAAENLLVVTLNAIVIFEDNVYFPATAPVAPAGQMYSVVIPFDTYTFNAGAASNLQLGWGTALATGKTSLQGWFTPA